MKKALYYAGILIGLSSCLVLVGAMVSKQQERRHRQQVAAEDEMRLPSKSQRFMKLVDKLDDNQRMILFRQYNVAALFEVSKKYPVPQNGFVGPTPQRLEVVFKRVIQDAQNPGIYHIVGLTRTKGTIQAIQGTIELRQVRYAWSDAPQTYIATGTFQFAQPAHSSQPAASWQGLVAVDFEVKNGQAQLFFTEGAMLPVTRGFAFEGTRSNPQTKQPERVIWAANFGPLGSSILEGFGPGGRSEEVAPRYRKYGWDKYWENDEWWAASPKPKLSL